MIFNHAARVMAVPVTDVPRAPGSTIISGKPTATARPQNRDCPPRCGWLGTAIRGWLRHYDRPTAGRLFSIAIFSPLLELDEQSEVDPVLLPAEIRDKT